MNISGNITVFTNRKERCFWYKIYDLEPEEVFTVHSRGVFTHDKSCYFSNSKVQYMEKVFTRKRCSLIRGVHYEIIQCHYERFNSIMVELNISKNVSP